jgi:hypothetical protein
MRIYLQWADRPKEFNLVGEIEGPANPSKAWQVEGLIADMIGEGAFDVATTDVVSQGEREVDGEEAYVIVAKAEAREEATVIEKAVDLSVEMDEAVDEIYEIVNKLSPALALDVLTAAVMGTLARCDDPHRGMLGVIAELINLVRFAETTKKGGRAKALPLERWIRDTWEEE